MEASSIEIKDKTPASKKLQASYAKTMLEGASKLVAMKGKKVTEFSLAKSVSEEAIAATLGPTGNMRAPTVRIGKTILVGFNEEIFAKHFA